MQLSKKIIFFLSTFTLALIVFSYLVFQMGQNFSELMFVNPLSFFGIFFFIFLQIAGVVFSSILSSSRFIIVFFLGITTLTGLVVFNSFTSLLFTIGIPSSFLFWKVHEEISSRIRIRFISDVRQSITIFFLLFIFFSSFTIVPHYTQEIENSVVKWISSLMQGDGITGAFSLGTSMKEAVNEEIEKRKKMCDGDEACQQTLAKEIKQEMSKYAEDVPFLSNIDIESEDPFLEDVTKNMTDVIPQQYSIFPMPSISKEFIFGFLISVLLSPFSLILSFFAATGIRILYYILRITGVLCITTKSVQQEIIV